VRTPEQIKETGADSPPVLYIYWCRKCEQQFDRLFHTIKGNPLFPQTDDEHQCERIEVTLTSVAARRIMAAEERARQAEAAAREQLDDLRSYVEDGADGQWQRYPTRSGHGQIDLPHYLQWVLAHTAGEQP
jgi:hypothetical protein